MGVCLQAFEQKITRLFADLVVRIFLEDRFDLVTYEMVLGTVYDGSWQCSEYHFMEE